MIVRIMGEGQFRIDDSDRDNLNELDNAAARELYLRRSNMDLALPN